MVLLDQRHLRKKVKQRDIDVEQLKEALLRLKGKLKRVEVRQKYSRVEWYYPVKSGKEIDFYIVGRGIGVASVLAADMTPYGKELR